MNEGEVWASIRRLMTSGFLHQGADFAFLRLCPSPGEDDSEGLLQALSGTHPEDLLAAGAWARAREYSGWAVTLMEKNAGKEDRAPGLELAVPWATSSERGGTPSSCATTSPRGLLASLSHW